MKPLFRGDMTEQGRKLMRTLTVVVNGLGNLEAILPAASALAKNHVTYGVKASHYTPVGAALLWTLERGLGTDWTPEVQNAWSAAYATLSSFMINEAYGTQAAAANEESAPRALEHVPQKWEPVLRTGHAQNRQIARPATTRDDRRNDAVSSNKSKSEKTFA